MVNYELLDLFEFTFYLRTNGYSENDVSSFQSFFFDKLIQRTTFNNWFSAFQYYRDIDEEKKCQHNK